MNVMPSELLSEDMGARKLSKILQRAMKAAQAVWKKCPEFKTVILDTYSQEEREMMETARKAGKKGGS